MSKASTEAAKNGGAFLPPDVLIKSKLDSIWSELQTNLPTISFDDEDFEARDNDDGDDDAEYYGNGVHALADPDLDSASLINLVNSADNDFYDDDDDYDRHEPHGHLLNNNEIFIKLDKSKASAHEHSTGDHVKRAESVAMASKITKAMFDQSNSKLNMEIFEYIDIDQLVDAIPSRTQPQKAHNLTTSHKSEINDLYSNSNNNTREHAHKHYAKMHDNDEKILQKLQAMSMQMYENKNNNSESSMQTQTDDDNNNNNNNDPTTTTNKNLYKNIYDTHDEPYGYGNTIETKKIDLRPSSTVAVAKKKLSAFDLLEKELNMNVHQGFRGYSLIKNAKNNAHSESESTSDEDDDKDDGDSLWIGRYRKTKLEMNKK